jgi:bifunctional DNA-binding transcriptional regulator/antitoxin component of YhaV-PrlF toxin-antitoxin module
MGRRKISEENIRKIQKVSRSYYVTIPVTLVREFKWQEGQKLVIEKSGKGKITIEDWKP